MNELETKNNDITTEDKIESKRAIIDNIAELEAKEDKKVTATVTRWF